jgi:hypothetical protein
VEVVLQQKTQHRLGFWPLNPHGLAAGWRRCRGTYPAWSAAANERMEKALCVLLDDLVAIMDVHEDVGDTEVSILVTKAINDGFISPRKVAVD